MTADGIMAVIYILGSVVMMTVFGTMVNKLIWEIRFLRDEVEMYRSLNYDLEMKLREHHDDPD